MVDLLHHEDYNSCTVCDILDNPEAAFVPSNIDESTTWLVHAARSQSHQTPTGVVVFRGREGTRDALTRADLWACLHDRVLPPEPLEFQTGPNNDCWRAPVPAVVAGNGIVLTAVYLAAHGFSNGEIAGALNVGTRTVSQYLTDFRCGKR